MRECAEIIGMPFFPGVVVGKLHRGMKGARAGHIVLVSQDDIQNLNSLPAAFIIIEAAPFSHAMIRLLGMGVPTVLISSKQATSLRDDQRLLIDGSRGLITDRINGTLKTQPSDAIKRDNLQAGEAVLMADSEPVNLLASVRSSGAAGQAQRLGATAIGLVRSEFLMPEDGRVPGRAFYMRGIRDICEASAPLPVTFRLLDVAEDKIPVWLTHKELLGHALGLQGVRLYGLDPIGDVINAQLDAISELTQDFDLRLLIPYLVRLEELEHWLDQARLKVPDSILVGAMAETPASVLDIARLLEQADFVAIGCNDLMQGLFAADRDQADLRHYLDPYAPLLYRLFRQVAEESGEKLQKIQLCGVLPQIQGVLPLLLGLGYRSFSVDAPFIPYLADIVGTTSQAECKSLATDVCSARITQEVLEILNLPTDRHPPFKN